MPRIVEEAFYGGAKERLERLGLADLLETIRRIIPDFPLEVLEKKDANGGAEVRAALDRRFEAVGGWVKKQTGDVDWTISKVVNGTKVSIGVEIQVSARSDLIVVDLIHLRKSITNGLIDIGVLVVPSDLLGSFLTDRAPRMSDAKRHVREARVEDLPLILVALEHDGPGAALPKRSKRS
jgi:hypothetical protein